MGRHRRCPPIHRALCITRSMPDSVLADACRSWAFGVALCITRSMPDSVLGGDGGDMNDTPYQYVPHGVDPTRPSAARLYDYYLGGTTNFPSDRAVAEGLKAEVPDLIDAVWAHPAFPRRAPACLPRPGDPHLHT